MKKIAIACQGGGNHTALPAGALAALARNWKEEHRLVGISGTSGGAICTALFWSAALLENGKEQTEEFLEKMAVSGHG